MGASQKNKQHKSGRNSGIGRRHKFKESDGVKRVGIKAASVPVLGRSDRLHKQKLAREQKLKSKLDAKRTHGPPKVVLVYAMSAGLVTDTLLAGLATAASETAGAASGGDSMDGVTKVSCPFTVMCAKQKMRATFLTPARDDLFGCLEACKAADALLLVCAPDCAVDATADQVLTALRVQGMPPPCVALHGVGTKAPMHVKAAAKKAALAALEVYTPEVKVILVDGPEDCGEMWRFLGGLKAHAPVWRSLRPWVLAEQLQFVGYSHSPDMGQLCITGYVRSGALSADQLVHIAGAGDFQIAQIEGPAEPCPYSLRERTGAMEDAPSTVPLLATPTDDQEPLVTENKVDPLAGEQGERLHARLLDAMRVALRDEQPTERAACPSRGRSPGARAQLQRRRRRWLHERCSACVAADAHGRRAARRQTWPTEEEMAEAEREAEEQIEEVRRKKMRKVPKGTSAYQAAWLIDSDSDSEDEDEGKDGGEMGDAAMDQEERADVLDASDEEEVDEPVADETNEEHAAALAAELARRKTARENMDDYDPDFPDEMDTPIDVPARKRFERYRGLKSFRTSAWDVKESLPLEYAKIFAFANFKRAMRKARENQAELELRPDSVDIGTYVRVWVKNVPAATAVALLRRHGAAPGAAVCDAATLAARPLVACGLLQHESKLTVMNMSASLRPAAPPLRSKAPLVFCIGFRQFCSRPLYSTDNPNQDKHKFERYLQPGAVCAASVYGPITYAPGPVLAFALNPDGSWGDLQWSGSVTAADPDRINLKRIIISGIPHKVHKRKSLVQFMFHNPEDVRYFRPLELWTKYGRRGRIKESVGTHGRMKCIFDGVLQQRDTVCISLYKRVYPPFPDDVVPLHQIPQ